MLSPSFPPPVIDNFKPFSSTSCSSFSRIYSAISTNSLFLPFMNPGGSSTNNLNFRSGKKRVPFFLFVFLAMSSDSSCIRYRSFWVCTFVEMQPNGVGPREVTLHGLSASREVRVRLSTKRDNLDLDLGHNSTSAHVSTNNATACTFRRMESSDDHFSMTWRTLGLAYPAYRGLLEYDLVTRPCFRWIRTSWWHVGLLTTDTNAADVSRMHCVSE